MAREGDEEPESYLHEDGRGLHSIADRIGDDLTPPPIKIHGTPLLNKDGRHHDMHGMHGRVQQHRKLSTEVSVFQSSSISTDILQRRLEWEEKACDSKRPETHEQQPRLASPTVSLFTPALYNMMIRSV